MGMCCIIEGWHVFPSSSLCFCAICGCVSGGGGEGAHLPVRTASAAAAAARFECCQRGGGGFPSADVHTYVACTFQCAERYQHGLHMWHRPWSFFLVVGSVACKTLDSENGARYDALRQSLKRESSLRDLEACISSVLFRFPWFGVGCFVFEGASLLVFSLNFF